MFKSLKQLVSRNKKIFLSTGMKNVKIDDDVHRLLKTQAAILGFKVTDLASSYLYAALTTPDSTVLKAALDDLARATKDERKPRIQKGIIVSR